MTPTCRLLVRRLSSRLFWDSVWCSLDPVSSALSRDLLVQWYPFKCYWNIRAWLSQSSAILTIWFHKGFFYCKKLQGIIKRGPNWKVIMIFCSSCMLTYESQYSIQLYLFLNAAKIWLQWKYGVQLKGIVKVSLAYSIVCFYNLHNPFKPNGVVVY